MCILFIYADPRPPPGKFRLIIASNRDEYYKRPAKNLFLCAETKIMGGRDMELGREGGMWLGITTKDNELKFGALLNVTGEDKKAGVTGRGGIVYNYLRNDQSAKEYIDDLTAHENYNAYNFVAVELTRGIEENEAVIYHQSNSPEACFIHNDRQILAFGNSTPTSPLTKVQKGKKKFEKIIADCNKCCNRDELIEKLIDLLKSAEPNLPDPELERRSPIAYEFLSSIYVKFVQAGYGTRTHSVILVDYDWNVDFVEHTMKEPIDPNYPEWVANVIKSNL